MVWWKDNMWLLKLYLTPHLHHYRLHLIRWRRTWARVSMSASRKLRKMHQILLPHFYVYATCLNKHREVKCSGPHIPHQDFDKLISDSLRDWPMKAARKKKKKPITFNELQFQENNLFMPQVLPCPMILESYSKNLGMPVINLMLQSSCLLRTSGQQLDLAWVNVVQMTKQRQNSTVNVEPVIQRIFRAQLYQI